LGQVQKSAGFNFLVHYHLYIPSSQSNKWNVIILTFINEIYKPLLPKVYFVKTVPSHASTLPSAVMDLKTVTTEVTNQQQ
jgi:hypothetical protein